MSRRGSLPIVIAVLVLAATGLARATKEQKPLTTDELIRQWGDGPVRYLMSTKEEATLRGLKTVPDLQRFITDFWARRDPSPGTVENEFRQTYWQRVIDANKRFRDSTTPGWKTDRGKVFILLGEPFQTERDEHPEVPNNAKDMRAPDRDPGVRGIERWTYHRKFSTATDPEFVVAFVRDQSLDWKLSSNPALLKADFPGVNTLDSSNQAFGGVENRGARNANQGLAAGGVTSGAAGAPGQGQSSISAELSAGSPPAFDTSAFANWDLGLELTVPSNTQEVMALVSTREFVSGFVPAPRFEYFRAADGSTFVNIGGLVTPKDLYGDAAAGRSNLRVHASLVPDADPSNPRYASNENAPLIYDLAKGPEPGGVIDVWTGVAAPPGKYKVTLAVEDALTGRLGRATAEIEVPDFSSSLALSTLVLGSSLSNEGGKLGVNARSSGVFRKAEDFAVYYQVYGLVPTEAEKKFDVSYRFYRETPQGPQPIGKPIVPAEPPTEAEQGWTFPLAKWPPGKYRIEVTVTGAGGKTVSAQAPFEVIE